MVIPGSGESKYQKLLLMGTEFQFYKIEEFWKWMVVMKAYYKCIQYHQTVYLNGQDGKLNIYVFIRIFLKNSTFKYLYTALGNKTSASLQIKANTNW